MTQFGCDSANKGNSETNSRMGGTSEKNDFNFNEKDDKGVISPIEEKPREEYLNTPQKELKMESDNKDNNREDINTSINNNSFNLISTATANNNNPRTSTENYRRQRFSYRDRGDPQNSTNQDSYEVK